MAVELEQLKQETYPIVKWVGGKRQLMFELFKNMPENYNRYFEPFIGGGALLLNERPERVVISDVNEQLINIYLQLQADPRAVIREVNRLDEGSCDKDYYLATREAYNKKIQALNLFLNLPYFQQK